MQRVNEGDDEVREGVQGTNGRPHDPGGTRPAPPQARAQMNHGGSLADTEPCARGCDGRAGLGCLSFPFSRRFPSE